MGAAFVRLLTAWDWQPTVVAGCVALAVAYVLATREWGWRASLFLVGDLILLLALVSPLDTLSDTYLFSAHMAQHLILLEVVPLLLLLGTPPDLFSRLLKWQPAARAERVLGRPIVAWCIGAGTIWLWHVPLLYNATLANEGIHVVEHLCFLVSATIFWWPILGPDGYRPAPWWALAYLVVGAVSNTILAILLTFAPAGLYPAYLHPDDTLGILPMLREGWRLTPQVDQAMGGAIMWIPGGWIYLLAIVGTFARWYMASDEEEAAWAGLAEADDAAPRSIHLPNDSAVNEGQGRDCDRRPEYGTAVQGPDPSRVPWRGCPRSGRAVAAPNNEEMATSTRS